MVQRTRLDIATQIASLINDNAAGEITAADVRSILTDLSDSLLNRDTDTDVAIISDSIPDGTLLRKRSGGGVEIASIVEGINTVASSKIVSVPDIALDIGSWRLENQGQIIGIRNRADGDRMFYPIASEIGSTGSVLPRFFNYGASQQFNSVPNTTETTGNVAQIEFVFVTTDNVLASQIRINSVTTATDVNLQIRTSSQSNEPPAFDWRRANEGVGFNLTVGANLLTLPVSIFFLAAQQLYFRLSVSTGTIDLRGQTITSMGPSQFVPFTDVIGRPATIETVLTSTSGVETIQDIVGNMFTGGVYSGITPTYDDVNGKIDLSVGAQSPAPSFTSFSISGQSSSVNPGTTISGTQNFIWALDNISGIVGNLSILRDTTVLVNNLVPSSGSAAVDVGTTTLTNAGDSVTFTIRGIDNLGNTIERSTTITAVSQQEQFYSGFMTSNIPATVDLSTLTSREAVTGSFDITLGPTVQNEFIVFLTPGDHDITSIVNRRLNVDVITSYTKTTDVRTISGQLYNSYVFGPITSGFTVSYRITLA